MHMSIKMSVCKTSTNTSSQIFIESNMSISFTKVMNWQSCLSLPRLCWLEEVCEVLSIRHAVCLSFPRLCWPEKVCVKYSVRHADFLSLPWLCWPGVWSTLSGMLTACPFPDYADWRRCVWSTVHQACYLSVPSQIMQTRGGVCQVLSVMFPSASTFCGWYLKCVKCSWEKFWALGMYMVKMWLCG